MCSSKFRRGIFLAGVTAGCGVVSKTCPTALVAVDPAAATADHLAAPPGDQQGFLATESPAGVSINDGASCAVPQYVAGLSPNWTVSDTINVKISSAQDDTNGVATCIGATKGAVTLTAIGSPGNGAPSETLGTASLTCK